jgi:nucleotide-binding universal stress UspA family protein
MTPKTSVPLRSQRGIARAPTGAHKPQRVLVPVDGSANALRALEYLVRRSRTDSRPFQITVLNVQPNLPTSRFVSRAMLDEHYAKQSEEALAAARRLLEQRKLKADIRVLVGEPASAIVDLATRTRCSEIVIGTRGLGGLKGLLLGSVAAKVIQLSTVPVTVVP